MSKQAIDSLVSLAMGEVGVREESGENRGRRIVEYQGATWLQPGAWPWCAAFTCWLMREWLEQGVVVEAIAKHLNRPSITLSQADKYRCRDASAFGWEKWSRSIGIPFHDENTTLARSGDFVVFDFSHIGLVVKDQGSRGEDIVTIEGNTNKKGEREGDGVFEKVRSPRVVKSYIRIFS